jgi:hypothetical protein
MTKLICITIIAWSIAAAVIVPRAAKPRFEIVVDDRNEYQRGVNDAMDCWARLAFEQELQRTNRTFDAMSNIVAGRCGVERVHR